MKKGISQALIEIPHPEVLLLRKSLVGTEKCIIHILRGFLFYKKTPQHEVVHDKLRFRWGGMKIIALFFFLCTASFAQDKAFGEYLSGECVTCHQMSGKTNGIPPIIGYPAEVLIEFMGEYKSKKRSNTAMQNIAAKYNDAEIAALAAYFASIMPK
jgi:cytochrome c553